MSNTLLLWATQMYAKWPVILPEALAQCTSVTTLQ